MFRFLPFLFVLIPLASCQPKSGGLPETSTKDCSPLKGKYINISLVDNCDSVLYASIPYFVSELTFIDSTNVKGDNGFEHFPLQVSFDQKSCSGIIKHATVEGDMPFQINGNGDLILDDTKWTKSGTPSVFLKSDNAVGGFREEMSRCLFPRPYIRIENDKPVRGTIMVLSNGQMDGMPPYIGYSVCLAGDCMEEADPFHPTIIFSTLQGEKVTYAFKKEGKDIRFYNLGPVIADQKGGRVVKDLAFIWREQ